MSEFTYNTLTAALGIGVLVAFLAMIVSLIAMLVRWKTPKRRGHAMRLLAAIAAIPILIGIQQAILWQVFLPSLGRRQMAKIYVAREQRLAETSVVRVGDQAPQFSLITADGDEFSAPQPGKITLINFFATWCGPCQAELPHLERIWAARKNDERFRLLVIGREETKESVQEHRDKHGFSFPIAPDPDRKVYSLFATESIPRTLVVSPEGRIVYSKAGFHEEDLKELNSVLEEQFARRR
jgi:peroxiredoxin